MSGDLKPCLGSRKAEAEPGDVDAYPPRGELPLGVPAAGAWPPISCTPRHDILIIEDHLTLRHSLKRALQAAGFRVRAHPHGLAALLGVAGQPPRLVLLNPRLPHPSGQLLTQLMWEVAPTLPFVLLSSHSAVYSMAEALGARGVLLKPFDRDELLLVVQRALQRDSFCRGGRDE